MISLPTEDIRSNVGTWAVPDKGLPALGHWMHDALPNEPYDPHFVGQDIDTYYFDTRHMDLRKARRKKDQYCTLRIRCYPNGTYALSAKTESEKFRQEIPMETAAAFLLNDGDWEAWLPANILGRLLDIVNDPSELQIVVKVCSRRYAIENEVDRFTLDVGVYSNLGKHLPFNVLEMKSTEEDPPPASLLAFGFMPIKLSKFLWSTEI
jgi:hypothetical protein